MQKSVLRLIGGECAVGQGWLFCVPSLCVCALGVWVIVCRGKVLWGSIGGESSGSGGAARHFLRNRSGRKPATALLHLPPSYSQPHWVTSSAIFGLPFMCAWMCVCACLCVAKVWALGIIQRTRYAKISIWIFVFLCHFSAKALMLP